MNPIRSREVERIATAYLLTHSVTTNVLMNGQPEKGTPGKARVIYRVDQSGRTLLYYKVQLQGKAYEQDLPFEVTVLKTAHGLEVTNVVVNDLP